MDCSAQTAFVSWFFSAGALSYIATMKTDSGHTVTCSTNHTNCVMSDLACGEHYSVSVLAQGETCSSISHMAGTLETGEWIYCHLHAHIIGIVTCDN